MPSSACQKCARSEEHTSELQSHDNLVCRLLLEKKIQTRPLRTSQASRAALLSPHAHWRARTVCGGSTDEGGRGRVYSSGPLCLLFFFTDRPTSTSSILPLQIPFLI